MTELIQRELFQLFIMFYCGLALSLLFSARDRLMARCGTRRRLQLAIYFGFWIFASFLFYRYVYRASHGVLTVYGICAMLTGVFLWKKVVYGILKEK